MLANAILTARRVCGSMTDTLSYQHTPERVVPRSTSSYGGTPVANDNARTTGEELAARLKGAQRELALVSMHLSSDFREGTIRQLRKLLDPESWEEGDQHLDLNSFISFARGMAVLSPRVRPMLGLSNSGNLLAMWGSGTERLSLEHLANDELRWFVHSNGPEGRDSAAGSTTIARLAQIIAAHGMDRLVYGEG